jgi:uncharacterized protein
MEVNFIVLEMTATFTIIRRIASKVCKQMPLAARADPAQLPINMQAVTDRLKNFLQYVAVNLIEEPNRAQLKVTELGPQRLRFKLILAKQDVAMIIGRNGFTASAIRSVLKAGAERDGVQVSLQIHSHEEEDEMLARGDGH